MLLRFAQGFGRAAIRLGLLPAVALLVAACTTAPREQEQPWYAGATDSLYDELRYWPEQVAGRDDGNRCVPDAEIDLHTLFLPEGTSADLWEHVREGFSLGGSVDEQRIARQMRLYSDRQRFFDHINDRASWYMQYVVSELEARDMPLELALLPIVESAYNPDATSRSHAAGLWQMIPGTARHLGLQQNNWYDGRRDVVASTEAALDYLASLHKRFDGDWYLALAAYNAGEGAVERAIERNRRLGKPTDYWSLPLSAQACNYVPRLLALSRILESPEEHGIEFSPIPNRPALASVAINEQVNLRSAAHIAGLDADELLNLNAALRNGYTAPNTTTTLLVPADQRDDLVAALESLPAGGADTLAETYKVRAGDTLGGIARLYRTTPDALRALNKMSDDGLVAGSWLKLPGSAVAPPREFPTTASVDLKHRGIYTVQRGDNLWTIARRTRVPVERIRALNGLARNAVLQPGQRLQLQSAEVSAKGNPDTRGATEANRMRIAYTVQSGDSLARIATRHKVRLPELLRWNGLSASGALIHPGQSLILWVDPTFAKAG